MDSDWSIPSLLGTLVGAFVLVSLVSRPIWYILIKMKWANDWIAMIAAFVGTAIVVIALRLYSHKPFDPLSDFAFATMALFWLALDWRYALKPD